jgi:hypothetical protein
VAEAPVRRAYQVYLYVVCFVSVLVLMFAGARALFGVVRIALPEQTAAEPGFFFEGPFPGEPLPGEPGPFEFDPADFERRRGVAELLENGILAGLAGGLFAFHWRRAARVRAELEAGEGGGGDPAPPGGDPRTSGS